MHKLITATEIHGPLEIELRDRNLNLLGTLKANKSSLAFRKPKAQIFRRIRYEHLPFIFEMHGRYTPRIGK